MDKIPVITEKIESAPDFLDMDTTLITEYGVTSLIWVSIQDLLQHPWFNRLWVLQEVVLAKDIIFVCGLKALSWRDLLSFAQHVFRTGILDTLDANCVGISTVTGLSTLHQFAKIRGFINR